MIRAKFQDSLDIHEFQQFTACDQARGLHPLSLVEPDKREAGYLLQESEKTRKELQGDRYDPKSQTLNSHDSLVSDQLR